VNNNRPSKTPAGRTGRRYRGNMNSQEVLLHIEDAVATITLNRPAVGNCISRELADGLVDALRRVADDASVRAVILCGNGKHFCTGGDIPRLVALTETAARYDEINNTGTVIRLMTTMPKPVVAAVHGMAAGAGLGFMLAADMIVCASDAKVMSAFAKVGLVSDCGVAYMLTRLLGRQKAKELLMLSDPLDAAELHRLGVVNMIVPADALRETAQNLARRLAAAAPLSMRLIKELVNESDATDLGQALRREESVQTMCLASDDFSEGATAFLERRAPAFTGK